MFRRSVSIVPAFLIVGLTISLLFAAISVTTFAQGDPTPTPFVDSWYIENPDWDAPYPEPGTSVGDATWVIDEATFVSEYPRGFTFSIQASSSVAPITVASIIWSHTPNELQRIELQNVPADGTLRIQHRLTDSLPPWAAVNYYWSFIDANGNRFRTTWFNGQEYLPDDPQNWTRVESEDVIIIAQNDISADAIPQTIDAMAQQRATFLQAWGALLPYKPRVILFSSRDDFNTWFRSSFGTAILGITDPAWGATVQVRDPQDPLQDLTYGTVPHEIGHLYQFEFVGDRGFPAGSWFTEGNATLFELSQLYDYENRLRNIAIDGDLPPLLVNDSLFAISAGPDEIGRFGYDIGFTFWKWFITEYGLDGHRQLVEQLAVGVDRNDALENVTGLSIFEIETAWAQWLGADGAAPPILTPSQIEYQFPATPTPFFTPQ